MSAKVRRDTHTAIINDTSQEIGSVRMVQRKKNDIVMRIDFTQPDPRSVGFQGRKAEIYYPKINTVQEFDLGKHKTLVDQFLLLGFGTSGREMARAYQIKAAGTEKIGPYTAEHLELTPKSGSVAQHLKRVDLWIHETGGYPVRQKFIEPSGNYTLIEYSEVEWNPALKVAQLALDIPKNAKREFPQK
jgi:outer membrane lipoprotein-sorting protein